MVDIVTLTLTVLETSISKALNNDKVDEREFYMLQTLVIKGLNELTGANRKMEAENGNQFEKCLLEDINNMKNTLKTTRTL